MPIRKPWDHPITLKDDFKPDSCPIYPMNLVEQDVLAEWIKEQLAKGYIRLSTSPQTCPVFFVPKPNNGKRLVIDYGYLNKYTVRDAYPLPLIPELMDMLCNARYFTKMDLHWGFYNICLKEGNEWKAAFTTCRQF